MANPIKKIKKLEKRFAKKAAKGRMYKGEQMSKKDILKKSFIQYFRR